MKSDSGATTSIWMATTAEIPAEGKLLEDTSADVCIVGAGIAGMTVINGPANQDLPMIN